MYFEDGSSAPVFPDVPIPDALSLERMAEVFAATPRGLSLGRLGEIASHMASFHKQIPPNPITRARVVVFAGDHGISQRRISAFAPTASVEQAEEIQAGGGPVNVMARAAGASVRLVDTSLDRESFGEERVTRSTPPVDSSDAMTAEQFQRAITIGARIADQEIDSGADVLIPGSLGVGVSTIAATLVGTLCSVEPVAIVGPGSGITDEMWKRKVTAIRDTMFRVRSLRRQPNNPENVAEILRQTTSPDVAAMTAFIAQAAVRRTPVLLDDLVVSAAALAADRLAPGVKNWLLGGQLSLEPGHLRAVETLGITPLLSLNISTGQSTGALAALPLLKAACELAADEVAAARGAGAIARGEAEAVTESDI